MENQKKNNQHAISNFWFGFAIGSATIAGAVFFLGTKQGRGTLKKILELSENLEDHVGSFVQELEQTIEEKADEVKHEFEKKESGGLHSILTKIKDLSPQKKEVKKFFEK